MNATAYQLPPASVNMILGQLTTNQILEPNILNAFKITPREAYVPKHLAASAYVDEDLHLGDGRFLLAPLTFARMVKMAELKTEDIVLDIGANYGYSAALLSTLTRHVTACEISEAMRASAEAAYTAQGVRNVKCIRVNHLKDGYAPGAPYDVIFIEGAVESVPETLFTQLKEGGRLICIQFLSPAVAIGSGLGRLQSFQKIDGKIFGKDTFDVSAPLLPGFTEPKGFAF